jgi:prepilin-type N-terminal cleavage/methylation domain-containing protein
MKRPNFRQGGFTLVELVFVIAIIVVLASIFLPLAVSKLKKADESAADASAQEIAAALTAFYDDLRHFPTCGAGAGAATPADCSPLSGSNNDLIFLAFGDGSDALTSTYPDAATGGNAWDLAVNDASDPATNNAFNHLVRNFPRATGTEGDATQYQTSGSKRWRGPYISRVSIDPWGRTYIAYVGAMESGGTKVSGSSGTHRGWILSAGPNNSLDTTPTSTSLNSDDRGFIFHTE